MSGTKADHQIKERTLEDQTRIVPSSQALRGAGKVAARSAIVLGVQLSMKGKFMKKARSTSDELRAEYKRSDFKKLERGKYYERVQANSNVVVLDPDVAAVFPHSAAVNKALHSLVEVAESVSGLSSGSSRRSPRRRTGT